MVDRLITGSEHKDIVSPGPVSSRSIGTFVSVPLVLKSHEVMLMGPDNNLHAK